MVRCMCWNQEISATVASAGYIGSYALKRSGAPKSLYVPMAYFATMEALQAGSYFVVDDCGDNLNKITAFLAYIHICFQGVFVNWWFSYFTKPGSAYLKSIKNIMYLCTIGGVLMALRLVPYNFADNLCQANDAAQLCGATTCTKFGNWHLYWELAINAPNYVAQGMGLHFFMMFCIPIAFGHRSIAFWIQLLTGPLLFYFLVGSREMPAIWCLFATTQLAVSLVIYNRRKLTS